MTLWTEDCSPGPREIIRIYELSIVKLIRVMIYVNPELCISALSQCIGRGSRLWTRRCLHI